MTESTRNAVRHIPYMGVIYVVAEAMKLGFYNGHPDWCNLGQGQPEVGSIVGAPDRPSIIELEPGDHAYGPIGGTDELRQTIAQHYNRLYRKGKNSEYTKDNVSVAAGGRLMLSRVFAALNDVNLGYQIPDYTAYEDMIQYHQHRITPVPIPTRPEDEFELSAEHFQREVTDRGLGAFVVSNPCNPTGRVIQDSELEGFVRISRASNVLLVLDEFYSHFIYEPDGRPGAGPVSGAAYVEDVDRDQVVLIDGLTKSFRYPGWRIGWAVGPKHTVEMLGRAASAIDGGPPQPVQRAAIQVLEPKRADRETEAVRQVFSRKRNLMIERLEEMGIRCHPKTQGTFYCWASIEELPPPFNDSETFFRRALEHKVMTVPGMFFDVNPGKRRPGPSPYRSWTRFSFGPPEDNVREGLDRLARMLNG